jgi:hypothetical protein
VKDHRDPLHLRWEERKLMLNHCRFGAILLVLGLGLLLTTPARAADLDKLLPEDTEFILTINVQQILDSALVKKLPVEMVKAMIKDNNEVTKILDDLGFDPFKDIETVIVASPGGQEADRFLGIVKGKFDEKKFKAKAKETAKENKDVIKIIEVPDGLGGKYEVYEFTPPDAGDQTFYISIADSKTILASGGKDYVVNALDQLKRGKAPTLKSKQMAEVLKRVDGKQSVWTAVVGSALEKTQIKDVDEAKEILEKLADASIGITIDKGIKLELGVTGKDAKAAKELDDKISDAVTQGQTLALLLIKDKELKPLLDIIKSIKTSLKDKTVTIKTEIGADILDPLIENFLPKDQ